MYTSKGQVVELLLKNETRFARISCPANLIPSPGQYLLAGSASYPDPLPVSLFSTESTPKSGKMTSQSHFIACAPIPENWTPGAELYLRGPLGRGFSMPPSARRIALVAFDDSPVRLQALMRNGLERGAAVVLVCETIEYHLPDEVEIQPLSALRDVVAWADYTAFDVVRENLPRLKEMLGEQNQVLAENESQVLIQTSMPCGGIAECGVCAVTLKSKWKLACKDGPVFDWREL